ncbi:hypothetical protein [Pararhodobacter sp.]|nr:hypothetical protein [Pararhodobacter sp.]
MRPIDVAILAMTVSEATYAGRRGKPARGFRLRFDQRTVRR